MLQLKLDCLFITIDNEESLGEAGFRYRKLQQIVGDSKYRNTFYHYVGDGMETYLRSRIPQYVPLITPIEKKSARCLEQMQLYYGKGSSINPLEMIKINPKRFYAGIRKIAASFCSALETLHSHLIHHGMLCIDDILIDLNPETYDVEYSRMLHYGLHYVFGRPVVNDDRYFLRYAAPESLFLDATDICRFRPKNDIWSMGMILAELTGLMSFGPEYSDLDAMDVMQSLYYNENTEPTSYANTLLSRTQCEYDSDFVDFITRCMYICPNHRDSATRLLDHPFIRDSVSCSDSNPFWYNFGNVSLESGYETICNSSSLYFRRSENLAHGHVSKDRVITKKTITLSIAQVKPDRTEKPRLDDDEEDVLAPPAQSSSQKNLLGNAAGYFSSFLPMKKQLTTKETKSDEKNQDEVPLSWSDNIVALQNTLRYATVHGMRSEIAERAYAHYLDLLRSGDNYDIPLRLRRCLWLCFLEIPLEPCAMGSPNDCFSGGIVQVSRTLALRYDIMSHENTLSAEIERQLSQDIPRCHQYHIIMRNANAKAQLFATLKTWLMNHESYEYWQGLDSIAATCTMLFLGNPVASYAILERMTSLHLSQMFCREGNKYSDILHTRLASLIQLLNFHDPELGSHLAKLEIMPDLFAIPWLLTLFSHILPFHILWPVWDEMVMESSSQRGSFVVLFAVSLLVQLRRVLLHLDDFGDCIAFLTTLPISLAQIVPSTLQLAREASKITPEFDNLSWARFTISYRADKDIPYLDTRTVMPKDVVATTFHYRERGEELDLKGVYCGRNEPLEKIWNRIKQALPSTKIAIIVLCRRTHDDHMILDLARYLIKEQHMPFVCVSEVEFIDT